MNTTSFPLPPLTFVAAAVTQAVVSRGAKAPRAMRALAVAVAAGAVAIDMGAAQRFRGRRTTVNPMAPESTSALVTDGPNAVTRNPMYVGLAGLLSAQALWRGRLVGWVPVAAFVGIVDRLQIPREEAALAARFGEEYARYKASVPRWLGPVR